MERRTRGREMTNKEVKNNFVQNLAENAYINMCSALWLQNGEVVSNDT